jgi:hypothetical protein
MQESVNEMDSASSAHESMIDKLVEVITDVDEAQLGIDDIANNIDNARGEAYVSEMAWRKR